MERPLRGSAGMNLTSIGSGSVTDVHVMLDDGRRLSIEMIDDDEIGFVLRDEGDDDEIVWSEVLDA